MEMHHELGVGLPYPLGDGINNKLGEIVKIGLLTGHIGRGY